MAERFLKEVPAISEFQTSYLPGEHPNPPPQPTPTTLPRGESESDTPQQRELRAAAQDIHYFSQRLSQILASDVVADYGRQLPEIMGYSKEWVDCLIENHMLANMSKGPERYT